MADERDPKLSQHYRSLEALEPSRELDQTILAAAHRATDRAHAPLVAPSGRHRWYYSLAAAAVLVFAVALTMHIERQQPDPEAAASASSAQNEQARVDEAKAATAEKRGQLESKPAARAEPFAPDPKPQAPASDAAAPAPQAPMADEMRVQREASSSQQGAAAAAKPAPSAAPARAGPSPQVDETQAAQAGRARSEVSAMQRYAASESAEKRAMAQAPPEKPERWLERIAELRSRGKHAEADKALAEFRRAYPDYRLSEVMRERVEGK
jgi:hypothetical protein